MKSHNCKNSIVFCIQKERYEGTKLGKGTLMRRPGKALLRESRWTWDLLSM